ncbi:MAG: metallophosphoesterase [Candidatus Thorarchaeota archaeon]|nr:metallophosphoesterase [Candidatus Thorarchaeota archaeon]
MIFRGEDISVLIITDIHLGYEVDISERKGVSFPSLWQSMYERVERLVGKYSIDEIYVIGDVKHTITIDRMVNWRDIPKFMEKLSEIAKVTVIPGNHDGEIEALLPRNILVSDVHGHLLEIDSHKIGLLHGHAWPSDELLDCQIMVIGHNHPSVRRLKDVSSPEIGRGNRLRASMVIPVVLRSKLSKNCVRRARGQLELNDDDCALVVLPSFNEMLAGVYVNRPKANLQGPLHENGCASLLSSEVYSTDGIFLGEVADLQARYDSTSSQRND